jgi:superoxide reductase
MKVYICKVCGHIEFGSAPETCPVCYAKIFIQNDNIFTESEEKSREAAVKHIPSVQVVKKCGLIPEETCTDILVRIGKTLHPMEEKHYITFIDCYIDDKYASRIQLTPLTWASVVFHIKTSGKKVTIVEKCNIHGYWKAEADL